MDMATGFIQKLELESSLWKEKIEVSADIFGLGAVVTINVLPHDEELMVTFLRCPKTLEFIEPDIDEDELDEEYGVEMANMILLSLKEIRLALISQFYKKEKILS